MSARAPELGGRRNMSPPDKAMVELFRGAISRFATGVAWVTCRDDAGSVVVGAEARSLTPIGEQPPEVMLSLLPGRAHRLITSTGSFGLSVLSDEQKHYLESTTTIAAEDIREAYAAAHASPTLSGSLAWFECQLTRTVSISEHTFFVAEISACGVGEGKPLMSPCRRSRAQKRTLVI